MLQNTPLYFSVISTRHLILSFLLGRGVRNVPAMFAGSLLQQWDHQRGSHAENNGLPSRFSLLAGSGSRTPALSSILPNRLLLSGWECCKYHFKGQKHHHVNMSDDQWLKHSNYFLFYYLHATQDPNPVPCPKGTYSRQPGLRDPSDCTKCPEGKYCYTENPQQEPIIEPVWLLCCAKCYWILL